MRVLAWILVSLPAFVAVPQRGPAPRDAGVAPTIGTASVSGVVVNDESPPKTVRRAVVTISGPDLRPSRSAITDDDGRFIVSGLPTGRLTVVVSRASFITSAYGAKRPARPGTAIVVAAGEAIRDLTVRIWRGAVVTGVVRNETGAPVAGLSVAAIPSRAVTAQALLTYAANEATTDDRGEYRLFGLEPGVYVIVVRPLSSGRGPLTSQTESQVDEILDALRHRTTPGGAPAAEPLPAAESKPFTRAPVYFPGTARLSDATPIVLAAGQEQTGVDLALQRVPTAVVSGTVTRPDGQPALAAAVQLTEVLHGDRFAQPPVVVNATADAGGAFTIFQVLPGEYRLIGRAPIDAGPPPDGRAGFVVPVGSQPSIWATTDVSVGGDDVTGLSLELQMGPRVTGRVVFDGTTHQPPADPTRFNVALILAEILRLKTGSVVTSLAATPGPATRADGTFDIANLAPGTYQFVAEAPTETSPWRARSAMMGDRDLLDGPVEITRTANVAPIVVTFSDRHTELSGRLQTASGAAVSDVFVIAFAEDRRAWGPGARRVRAVRPDIDGRYLIKDLPPGTYRLAAVTDVDPGAWDDPAFLDGLLSASIPVSIGEGETKTQNLAIGVR